MEIIVRNENKKDYRRVEEITRKAFAYPDRIERGGIGCPYEHWMVHELRRRDGILELSLVATVNDEFIGTGKTEKADNGGLWYEIYLDESKIETAWASEQVIKPKE